MNEVNLKNIVEAQIDTFLYAGNIAIELTDGKLINLKCNNKNRENSIK